MVYLANQDAPATYELFSVPIDGSALAVKLNPALVGNGNVSSLFEISPDSSTVVYRADQVVDDRFDLWSVPVGGGAAVKINGLLNANADVNSFAISPNGLQVVYLSDEYDDERFILFARPIGGGALLFVAEVSPIGGDIFEYRFTPDGFWVIFRADIDVDDRIELCRITTDGFTTATSFGGVPVANGDVFGFAISPDGVWVVNLADLDVDNVVELFTASTSGAVTGQISAALVGGGDVDSAYVISSNGQRVAYVADAVVDGRYELFSVFAGGGAVTTLNPLLPGGSSVHFDPLALPESGRFAYRVIGGFGFGPTELYSVNDDGSGTQLLSPVPANGNWTAQRQVAAAGGAHLFFELQSFPDLPETNATTIYRAAVGGGELIPVGPTLDLASGETYSWLAPAADPRQALFVSNEQTASETELYAGDICLLCDGFDSAGTTRWSTVLP